MERDRGVVLVVVILAAALGVSVVLFVAAASWALISDRLTLSDAQTALVSTVIGGLLGALSAYLGLGRGAASSTPAASNVAEKAEPPAEGPPAEPRVGNRG